MTAAPESPTSEAAVTREDREAAASGVLRRLEQLHGGYSSWMSEAVQPMLNGEEDDHYEVQAFARHRLAASTPGAEDDARLRIFLEILSAAGGWSDCSDWPGAWINAFCEQHEGRDPDTFNRAINLGYTRATYDSDTEHGVVCLTEAGTAFLATPPTAVKPATCPNCIRPGESVFAYATRVRDGDEPAAVERGEVARGALQRAHDELSEGFVICPRCSEQISLNDLDIVADLASALSRNGGKA